jgi:signal transduction histidine kinase
VEIALFRVVQESLTNIHRHSGASDASINFKYEDEAVILEVRDFGKRAYLKNVRGCFRE